MPPIVRRGAGTAESAIVSASSINPVNPMRRSGDRLTRIIISCQGPLTSFSRRSSGSWRLSHHACRACAGASIRTRIASTPIMATRFNSASSPAIATSAYGFSGTHREGGGTRRHVCEGSSSRQCCARLSGLFLLKLTVNIGRASQVDKSPAMCLRIHLMRCMRFRVHAF